MSTARSTDPVFLAGLVHRVAVWRDWNSDGRTSSLRAGWNPDWQAEPGMESVPCRATRRAVSRRDGEDKSSESARWVLLFGESVQVGLDRKFVYVDHAGVTHHLFPSGPAIDEDEQAHHWVVNADESPA
jgi:hypothetical protein